MKKSLFSTALLAASFAFSSTFVNAGEIADRVEKTKTLLVGTEGTYAPFTSHDKDGKLTGFDVVFMVLSLFKIKGMGFQTAFQAALAGGSLKAPKFTPQNAASRFR